MTDTNDQWEKKALKQNVSSRYEIYLSDSLPVWGSEEITSPHPVSFHSPLNLDLLIVGGTIRTQQLFNKKKELGKTIEQSRERQYGVLFSASSPSLTSAAVAPVLTMLTPGIMGSGTVMFQRLLSAAKQRRRWRLHEMAMKADLPAV